MAPSSDFRIILVGGGPVGLVAAHVFAAAGIDFVLLEQRPTIVPPEGAGIVLFPHTQRVFEQLGLMTRIREIAHRFSENRIVNSWGWHYHTTYTAKWTEENHGADWLFLHRPELLRVLYEALPDTIKNNVYAGKKVQDIQVTADGVIVQCADGTQEQGSMVIGADGVHSRVRNCMKKLAQQHGANATTSRGDEESLTSTYRCLYGNTGHVPGLELGPEWDLHSSGIAMQLFGARDMCWFLFYDKLPRTVKTRQRYTEDEMDSLAQRVADVHVTDKVRFKDVWDARKWVMLADLPEGIIKDWHWKRIVLVGDAANKQTPNIGQGWNCGVQDVVVLTNELRRLVNNGTSADIREDDLRKLFETYRDTRQPDIEACVGIAAGATRAVTWDTWLTWLKDRLLSPWTGGGRNEFRQAIGSMISKGQILDFIAKEDDLSGLVPWQHAP
ncbi:hypothetical protein PFICI_02628 [Pestalotiopsis fici W106-1]|uniref:FAD-binding domain-containing protein n=1 Tax=Pestalotiopsis fici (strain W106-1 / CGMCC3.15140) TaxID=1229662 RepID=W3XES5_PESFW|nr:uncharacterized protein PFICI_02628 [Pestalotiopsis fici W106-1]ETS84603.1 hypothetical protein PFICI_02628 [Pestalotiopsis fici W106-1]